MTNVALFVLAAVLEIASCFAFWALNEVWTWLSDWIAS
jgi:drug/metabolite transporter superfamily protein YnfA